MPRSHIHRAPHDCSCPVLPGGLPWILETVGLPCEFILRRPCGALQKLEEFNRKASVRSIADRRAAIVRAPHG